MSHPISLFTLTGTLDDIRGDWHGKPFDVDAYSRMKHGDGTALVEYGAALGAELLAVRPDLAIDPLDVVLPVAFMSVPPGCFYLASEVARVITAARAENGLPPARVVKIEKDAVTARDYAASSQADREVEMASIGFTLSEPVEDALVVLVDDVRVTGLAERTALDAIEAGEPAEVILGYVAVVADALRDTPEVESVLNHASVTSILDMLPAIERNDFALTIRFLKRALKSDPETLAAFAAAAPMPLLAQMSEGARRSGSAFVETYRGSLAIIDREARQHA